MTDLALAGCSTRPLGSYLKALGAFRIVAEQLDPAAAASWPADTLLLTSGIDQEALEHFFVTAYRPTPIVSPWNGSSGFDHRAIPEIELIIGADEPRLVAYQETIREGRAIAEEADGGGLDKEALLMRCRARLPDDAVAWLDAAVVLTDDRAEYPPLLGTGGNLGRLELSRNFMGHLARVLCLETGRRAPTPDIVRAWLRAALFDEGDPALVQQSIAQFDPGAAGGANMAPTGKAESVVNPWDYILILEGALLFASAVARRLGSDSSRTAAMPFTTRATPVGYTSNAQDEPAKGEFWAPLWQRPITLPELAHFLGEGRATWRGRQARTGLDFARAVASLGIDRGVDRFVRHAFVERLGQMTLAVPVGVVAVRDGPEVKVLAQLDPWLERIRGMKNQPAGVASALRRVEQAIYATATAGGPTNVQRVLGEVAGLHAAAARSPAVRERVGPLNEIVADDWLRHLEDDSDEFALAAGLASAHDRDTSLRRLLTSVMPGGRGRLVWSDRPAPVAGLGTRPVADVLATALQRLAVERGQRDRRQPPVEPLDHMGHGLDLDFSFQRSTRIAPVLRAAAGDLDEEQLAGLVRSLLLLSWHRREDVEPYRPRGSGGIAAPSPAAAVLLPFFHGSPLAIGRRKILLRVDPAWPLLLATGRLADVLADASRRLRMAGLPTPTLDSDIVARGQQGRWLAAAALCRLPAPDVHRLVTYANPPDPTEGEKHATP